MTSGTDQQVLVASEGDVVTARRRIREYAIAAGFSLTDVTRIVTAASELTRNLHLHAGGGRVSWKTVLDGDRVGMEMSFVDEGPGIADLERAFEPGYTSGRGLGMGLSGSKRLMDEIEIDSAPGHGTVVVARKWLR